MPLINTLPTIFYFARNRNSLHSQVSQSKRSIPVYKFCVRLSYSRARGRVTRPTPPPPPSKAPGRRPRRLSQPKHPSLFGLEPRSIAFPVFFFLFSIAFSRSSVFLFFRRVYVLVALTKNRMKQTETRNGTLSVLLIEPTGQTD